MKMSCKKFLLWHPVDYWSGEGLQLRQVSTTLSFNQS